MCYPPSMPDTPGPGYRLVEPAPELLRAFREECKLVGIRWRLKDEARRAAQKQVRRLQRGQRSGTE